MPKKSRKHLTKKATKRLAVYGSKKKTEDEANHGEEEPLILNKDQLKKYQSLEKVTKESDSKYEKVKDTDDYKVLKKVNPTIFYLNYVSLSDNVSVINLLLKEDNAVFASCLRYYLFFKDLVKGHGGEYPIIEQLIKHGFNTIFDILLENHESFYLMAFLSHLSSYGLIESSNDFLLSLKKNKLYEYLRSKKMIEALQKQKLYTRLKKYQV